MKRKLYERLKAIDEQNFVRFHYPGHKGRDLFFPPEKLAAYDMTETFGTDDLQAPEDVLLESQQQASRLFKTKQTFYGVGGSTMANYTAIAAATNPNETILVQRNSHRSIYDGAVLAQLKVETIDPNFDPAYDLLTGLDLKCFESKLRENASITAVVLTNPSYYGVCLKLKELVSLAHKYKCTVIVDEAHGGHLYFSHLNPYSALSVGADLVVHSAHKSLPAMTSTSLLHRNTSRVPLEKLRRFFNLYMTSSPSYILLLSIESALAEMDAHGKESLQQLDDMLTTYRAKYQALGARFWDSHRASDCTGPNDFTKLFFSYPGYRGEDLLQALYRKKVNLELADGRHVLAVLSTETTEGDLKRLYQALKELPVGQDEAIKSAYRPMDIEQVIDLKEAFYKEGQWIALEESQGAVALDFLQLYPPGIPLVIPGERITGEVIDIIKSYPVQGINDGRIRVWI